MTSTNEANDDEVHTGKTKTLKAINNLTTEAIINLMKEIRRAKMIIGARTTPI